MSSFDDDLRLINAARDESNTTTLSPAGPDPKPDGTVLAIDSRTMRARLAAERLLATPCSKEIN
jgi:hypothetical protein